MNLENFSRISSARRAIPRIQEQDIFIFFPTFSTPCTNLCQARHPAYSRTRPTGQLHWNTQTSTFCLKKNLCQALIPRIQELHKLVNYTGTEPPLEDLLFFFIYFLQARHPAYPRTRQTGQLHWNGAPPRRTRKSPRDDCTKANSYWRQILKSHLYIATLSRKYTP
jgi:hypothetical protein